MQLTPADHELARSFAGSLERQPARRSIDELSEAELLEIDRAFQRAKDSGDLTRACDERAMRRQMQDNMRNPLYRGAY